MLTKRSAAYAAVLLFAVACSKSEPPRGQAQAAPGAAAPAPQAAAAPADWSKVDKLVAAAKASDDFDAVFGECLSTGMDLALAKKITDIKTDASYYQHCEIGPARAQARIAIKGSKPGKMNTLCMAASMKADEIAQSGKPEADEFKKLGKDINKACGP
ncbi:MAG TPA: hypothetical protein VIF57_06460 [Polyangia bacterium]